MKIIPPYQISSEILNLINKAEKYVVLVSPYVNFKNWEIIKHEIIKAKQRGITIEFFIRYDADNNKSWEQVQSLGIQPNLVKNLHAKLYYNEKTGIVTSMNLLTSSNLSAIEFGSIYNTIDEVKELKFYVKQFLVPHMETELPSDDDIYLAKEKFIVILKNSVSNIIGKNCKCQWQNGEIYINANNQFYLGLDVVQKVFYIHGIITARESENASILIKKLESKFDSYTTIHYNEEKDYSNSISVVSKKTFSSDNFNFISVNEKKEIINVAINFIEMLIQFREDIYFNEKNASR